MTLLLGKKIIKHNIEIISIIIIMEMFTLKKKKKKPTGPISCFIDDTPDIEMRGVRVQKNTERPW